ncbi:hypothetical protein KUTeg_016050, partial [Tegillarca granosa]
MGTIESNYYKTYDTGFQSGSNYYMTYDTGFQSGCKSPFSAFRKKKVTKCKDVRAVSPSSIRFTKAVISSDFDDGYSLIETFLELFYIRPIIVMGYGNSLFVIRGNRRIFLARVLEANGIIRTVDVVVRPFDPEVFRQNFTSLNMGESVEVEKHPNMERKLNSFIQEYRRQKFA